MYVAITRAKNVLFLSFAKSRQKWWNIQYNKPSRFIQELEENVPHLLKYYDNSWSTYITNNNINKNLEEGDLVKHKLFGKGKILEIRNDVAIVKFFNPAFGTRKIDIKFLEKI
jgi:DNA helicase-2/ATP-dependent DNA helicase PcrA